MDSSTPSVQLAATPPPHSIAQLLPNEILDQIHESLSAIDLDVKVKGWIRKARGFAGVCSAWRAVALGRGEYSVYSMKSLKGLLALLKMHGDLRDGAAGLFINIKVETPKQAENRSAVLKQIVQVLPNLLSLNLILARADSLMISSELASRIDRSLWVEMTRLKKMKYFWLEGESIQLDDLLP